MLLELLLALGGVAAVAIHWNVGRLLDEQKRHHRASEMLLAEIRDRLPPRSIG